MRFYIFIIYLPFFVLMTVRHDVGTLPISVIGWNTAGLHYLIIYILLTLPFIIYMVFFLNRQFLENNKFIKYMTVISSIFITIGSFIPVIQTNPVILLAHTIVSVSSSILLMLTILFALVLHAVKNKHKIILLSFYGMYVAGLSIGFYILYTAALFQLMASISFMLILLVVNTGTII